MLDLQTVINLAKEWKAKLPFYQKLYEDIDLDIITDIKELPIWDKQGMLYYAIATGNMYYGEDKEGCVVTTSGHLGRPILCHPTDAMPAINDVFNHKVFYNVDFENCVWVLNSDFEGSWIDGPIQGLDVLSIKGGSSNDIIKAQLESKAGKTLLWIGYDAWLESMLNKKLIDVTNDFLIYIPRTFNPQSQFFKSCKNQYVGWICTEFGLFAQSSSKCDCKAEDGSIIYELHREDSHIWVTDDKDVIGTTIRPDSFTFINYKLGDRGIYHKGIKCKCGFEGDGIQFLERHS